MKNHKIKNIDEFLNLIEIDNDEEPNGIMYNLGNRSSLDYRYVLIINGFEIFIESINNNLSYIIAESLSLEVAKDVAEYYNCKYEEVYYGKDYWLRFKDIEDAGHRLLNITK